MYYHKPYPQYITRILLHIIKKKKNIRNFYSFIRHNNNMTVRAFCLGEPVTYRIRYRAIGGTSSKPAYRYEDIGNETRHTVVGLEPNTTHLFSIMARNMYGDSSYVSESLKVTTLSTSK